MNHKNKTTISIIAATSTNDALGKNNDLIWHLPNDFKRFKSMTTGHYIIMGRKTFESFPKPLPNRTHIIITKNKNYKVAGHLIVHSLKEALNCIPKSEEKAFIIGGGEIYRQSLSIADEIELTRVNGHFEADTFFPKINSSEWELIKEEEHPADEKHDYSFRFLTYLKK